MRIHDLRVSTKLWLAVGLIMAVISGVVLVNGYRSNSLQQQTDGRLDSLNSRLRAVMTWSALTQANAARTLAIVSTSDPNIDALFKAAIASTSARISEVQKSIESSDLSEEEKSQMARVAAARKVMQTERDAARKLRKEGNSEEATAALNRQYIPASEAYLQAIRGMVELEERLEADYRKQVAQSRLELMQSSMLIVALLLAGIGLGTPVLVRSIQQPLLQANAIAAKIAKGDLSGQIRSERRDEFGDLLLSLATMKDALATMVSRVRDASDQISVGSSQIAMGNADLAQRTEESASNLQVTASSVHQISVVAQTSADNSRAAHTLAGHASEIAQKSGNMVSQVVQTMDQISASSRKIADILGVIDGIAFQTNILALNAAVEAARAGEQGRGFAVVASEVRSLAGRSAEAARQIKSLIDESVDRVEAGTRFVLVAGETMTEMVTESQKVVDVVAQIATAATQQNSGIQAINEAVASLDQMTQQNASLVEESAAAAISLREQANGLAHAVASFQLSEDGRHAGIGEQAVL